MTDLDPIHGKRVLLAEDDPSARLRETKEVSDAVMRYGAALLIKPLDLDELEELVRRMLARPRPSSRPRLEDSSDD